MQHKMANRMNHIAVKRDWEEVLVIIILLQEAWEVAPPAEMSGADGEAFVNMVLVAIIGLPSDLGSILAGLAQNCQLI
jgi:hypothetical protein